MVFFRPFISITKEVTHLSVKQTILTLLTPATRELSPSDPLLMCVYHDDRFLWGILLCLFLRLCRMLDVLLLSILVTQTSSCLEISQA